MSIVFERVVPDVIHSDHWYAWDQLDMTDEDLFDRLADTEFSVGCVTEEALLEGAYPSGEGVVYKGVRVTGLTALFDLADILKTAAAVFNVRPRMVFACQNTISLAANDDDDYDGQPDEAQEWYDFDPDC